MSRYLALVLAACLIAASCTSGEQSPVTSPSNADAGVNPDDLEFEAMPEVPEASAEAHSAEGYEFTPLSSGAGGFVTGLDSNADGSVRLARTDVGGVYRWIEQEQRWQQLILADAVESPDATIDYAIEAMAIAPSDSERLYLAVGNSFREDIGRILISNDGGQSWTRSPQPFVFAANADWRTSGERLAVDPSDPDVVLLGTRTDGLWRSTDGAQSFGRVESVPVGSLPEGVNGDAAGVLFVVWDQSGDTVWAGVSGVGVMQSVDGGLSWSVLIETAGMPFDAEQGVDGRLWVVARDPGQVWVVDGDTVDEVTPREGRRFETVTVDPFDPNRALVGGVAIGAGDLYRTSDGGANWDDIGITTECAAIPWLDQYPNDFLPTGSLRFDRVVPDQVWVPEGFGVWRGTESGGADLDLVCEAEGIEELVSNDVIAPAGGNPVTAHWDRAIFWHGSETPADAVVHPVGRFQSAWDLDWTPAQPGFVVAVIGDQRPCCRGEEDSYLSAFSTDGGRTWEPFASYEAGHPSELVYGNIAISASNPSNIVWLPTFNGAPHFTTDGGASWTPVRLPGTEDQLNDNGVYTGGSHTQYFLNRRVLAADRIEPDTFYLYHRDLGVFRSADGGASWELQASEGLPTGWTVGYFNAQLVSSPTQAGHLFFTPGLQDAGPAPAYESTDGGATWRTIEGLSDVSAADFGAPLEADGPPAFYAHGRYDGERGLWRSVDGLGTWELISAAPGGNYQGVKAIAGDLDEPGTVYVGFTGTSFMVGRSAPTEGE